MQSHRPESANESTSLAEENHPLSVAVHSETKQNTSPDPEKEILTTLAGGALLGFLGVIGYPLSLSDFESKVLFIGIMMSMAAFISGFFTGTLFGIPKRKDAENSSYTLNNSLVEIADWLTKIIVGLGLVSLKKIPEYLTNMGDYVVGTMDTADSSISIYTICVVLFFTVFGLYIGYNYMRLVLSLKYKDADDRIIKELQQKKEEAEKKQEETEKQKNEAEQQAEKFKNVADDLTNVISQEKNKVNSPEEIKSKLIQIGNPREADFIDEMIAKAEEKLRRGIRENKAINDPQKNMWGGDPERNQRKLSAKLERKAQRLYLITMTVTSTNDKNKLDDGDIVLFALHDTWNPAYKLVTVEQGKAELKEYSYGSFTVGAFVDKGKTELELDLAELPDAPQDFKNT